jgi:hypothetical protein
MNANKRKWMTAESGGGEERGVVAEGGADPVEGQCGLRTRGSSNQNVQPRSGLFSTPISPFCILTSFLQI